MLVFAFAIICKLQEFTTLQIFAKRRIPQYSTVMQKIALIEFHRKFISVDTPEPVLDTPLGIGGAQLFPRTVKELLRWTPRTPHFQDGGQKTVESRGIPHCGIYCGIGAVGPRLGKRGVRGVQRGFLWRNPLTCREKSWTPRGVSRVCPVEGFDDITPCLSGKKAGHPAGCPGPSAVIFAILCKLQKITRRC